LPNILKIGQQQHRVIAKTKRVPVFLKHSAYIYTFFVDQPTGQTCQRIFTHDSSNDTVSRKGVPF